MLSTVSYYALPGDPHIDLPLEIRLVGSSSNQVNFDMVSLQASPTTLNDALVAYYPFNGNAKDVSGNGNHGTVNGANLTTDRLDNQNGAYNFDGVDDYVYLDDPITNSNPTFDDSISVMAGSFWFRTTDAAQTQIIFEEGGIANGLNVYIRDSRVWVGAWSETDAWDGTWLNTPTTANEWHHVIYVFDSVSTGSLKLFYDGGFVAETSVPTQISPHAGDDAIGSIIQDTKLDTGDQTGDGMYFRGKIDEVRFYNRALSGSEIQQLFSDGHESTIYVPAQRPTIQAGIDAAMNGEIVLVADGIYTGADNKNLDFNGKAIILKSENGPKNCIIDSENDGRGFYFHSGEVENTVVSGFTITNGYQSKGSGIHITDNSSPTITNSIVDQNIADGCFGGADPCATGYGGGIFVGTGCAPSITNSIISNNKADLGAGINCENDSSITIINSTIVDNDGGGVLGPGNSSSITNSIVWNNTSTEISGITTVAYSNVMGGYEGGTNIDADPLFVGNGDYRLRSGSACIDTGTSSAAPDLDIEGTSRPQGVGYDMGAYANKLTAEFSAVDTDISNVPYTVDFSELTIGTATTWQWDFDNDGIIDSEERNPTWTYDEDGSYTVALTVGNGSESHTESKEGFIKARIAPPLSVDLQAVSDSGVHDNDNLTNVSTPTIDITAYREGDTINIYRESVLLGQAALVSGVHYEYTFSSGQLTEGNNVITARSFDGAEESVDSPSLDIVLDLSGPIIVGKQPVDPVNIRTTQLESVTVIFSEALDFDPAAGSGGFWLDDVTITGPNGAISPTGIEMLGGNEYKILFEPQTDKGVYSISIGPNIEDFAGNSMDQDEDGISGEEEDDVFNFSFDAIDVDTIFSIDTIIASDDTTYDGQDIFIYGVTVTINGGHVFNSLYVDEDATLTHLRGQNGNHLTITGDLMVEAGGSIDADGRGYGSASGPGDGENGSQGGGGASHGGIGGAGTPGSGGVTYGSITEPTDLGSGGGNGYGYNHTTGGGGGGGMVRLTVEGTLTLEGSLTANGTNGGSSSWTGNCGGGGSGGSIYLTAGTLNGSGIISANGGVGGGPQGSIRGGGGAGGRIAIYYDSYDFTGSIASKGGAGKQYGGAGTIYMKSSIQTSGELRIDNGGYSGASTPLPEGEFTLDGVEALGNGKLNVPAGTALSLVSDALSIRNDGQIMLYGRVLSNENQSGKFAEVEVLSGGKLTVYNGGQLDCINMEISANGEVVLRNGVDIEWDQVEILSDGTMRLDTSETFPGLYIGSGGVLTHSTKDADFDLTITGDLTVEAGGSIDADGRGSDPASGPGDGENGSQGGGGAGHGGLGGAGTPGSGGVTYGSMTEPTDLGSGGGNGYGYNYTTGGGAGGGKVRLTVLGTLTHDGSLTANGTNGGSSSWTGNCGGGGSGGSIYLTAGTLTGSGVISANGGVGGGPQGSIRGGGGAGGRIAIYYDSYDFTGSIASKGGAGKQYGGAGTIYMKSSIQTSGELRIDNGGQSGASTPLPEGEFKLDGVEALGNGKLNVPAGTALSLVSDALSIRNDGQIMLYGQVLSSENQSGKFAEIEVLSGGKLTVYNGGQLKCIKMEVSANGEVVLRNGVDIEWDQVEILSDGIMRLDTSETFPSLYIGSGGVLTHSTKDADFDLTITGDLTIESDGFIDADGRGHDPASGPGDGDNGSQGGGGAGHGGLGGSGTPGSGGVTYGSITEPMDLGSGGGNGYGYNYTTGGGAGGGKVRLTVLGTLTHDGSLTANGTNGGSSSWTGNCGGGGSGGSIYLTAGTLNGSGVISANGGVGGGPQGSIRGGGGAGGRIAIYYDSYDFTGSIASKGGAGKQYGGAGTIYMKSSIQTSGELRIDNGGQSGASTPLPEGTFTLDGVEALGNAKLDVPVGTALSLVSDTLSIRNDGQVLLYGQLLSSENQSGKFAEVEVLSGGKLNVYNGGQLKCIRLEISDNGEVVLRNGVDIEWDQVEILPDGTMRMDTSETFPSLYIGSGGVLTHSTKDADFDLTITGDLIVEAGGSIDADGRGYGSAGGPGDGENGSQGGGGAGYGGMGGAGTPGSGGVTYGSITGPTDLGSGGGNGYGYNYTTSGGAGGGKVRLTVLGTLTLDGSLTANGRNGGSSSWTGNCGGGGSGGSIYLEAGTLNGSGVISANGGIGGGPQGRNRGGGGAGGRIAIYYDSYDFTGSIAVAGGAGKEYGGDGTVYTIPEEGILQLNKQVIGNIDTPYSVQNWQFSAVAGQQIRLENVNMSSAGIVFDLTGPNGWMGFTDLEGTSDLITLPESGGYVLTARGTGGANNRFYSFRLQETSVINLIPGAVYHGSFVGNAQAQLFKIDISESTPMRIVLDDTALNNINEVYAKFGSPPTRGDYDYRFENVASSDQTLPVPMATSGTWYILVYGEKIATPGDYTIVAKASSLMLFSITPEYHSNIAPAELTLRGAGFSSNIQVELVDSSGSRFPADAIQVDSFNQITATFAAGTVLANTYSVAASEPSGLSDQLSNAFTMTTGVGAKLETDLIVPSRVGYHNVATIWVEYANSGDAAMPTPLLVVTATQRERQGAIMKLTGAMPPRGFWTSAMPEGFANTVQFLATGNTPGVLQPGESRRVAIQYAGWQKPWDFSYSPITFKLGVLRADNDTLVDWDSLKHEMQPENITEEIWEPLWVNFASQVGSTWGDYVTMLTDNAAYLGRLGLHVTDIGELLSFEFAQADALNVICYLSASTDAYAEAPGMDILFRRVFPQRISSRYNLGAFGRGWSHNWNISLDVATDGTVTIQEPNGSRRTFQPDSRPGRGYFSMEGDFATLNSVEGGAFSLKEPSGLLRRFQADGKLDYVEDINGNRITAGYISDLLTNLTHSAGQVLQINYNASSLIETIKDSDGRETLFTYDAGNEHLKAVDYFDGSTVIYNYSIGNGITSEHAIEEIEFPGGYHQYFRYDERGRLTRVSRDNGAESLNYSYNSDGMVGVADAFDNANKYYIDHRGLIAKAENRQGNSIIFKYDDEINLTRITDSAGHSYLYEYDERGNLIFATDPLGYGTRFSYSGVLDRMTKLVDANGNITEYEYDSIGNLTSINYDDTSVENWEYDSFGSPTSWTNRRKTSISYEYDTDGRLTAKIFPDGSRIEYNYSARGNLISAADSIGTTTLEYDPSERLEKITYPGGRFLQYTYNDSGQRASMVNQLGHRIDYFYDATGRLGIITDETGLDIVSYHYDEAGRLVQKILGNGVYTTYKYDEAWRLIELVNHKPGTSILSKFIYTYDERGRRTSMNTLEGRWTYEYDNLGQLTSWTSPDGRYVEYKYDALGNRLTVSDNGLVTDYYTNNMNQYEQVGNTTYEYDDDGNVIQKISPLGTTTYTYNDENRLQLVSTSEGYWEYIYDAFGNRVQIIENGIITSFVHDPIGFTNVVSIYRYEPAELIAHFNYGFGLISRSDNQGVFGFYSFDATGNTREITSKFGVTLNEYDIMPFGKAFNEFESVENPFVFVGEYGVLSCKDNLNYMRARYYDKILGRFLSSDPSHLAGDDINLYRYTFNNPVQGIDPTGLRRCWIEWRGAHRYMKCDDGWEYHYAPKTFWEILAGRGVRWRERGGVSEDLSIGFYSAFFWNCWHQTALEYCSLPSGERALGKIPEPDLGSGQTKDTEVTVPIDPNEKFGPSGYGVKHLVAGDSILPYRIEFENESTATAPAQIVTITDQLDEDLNWPTFELTEIGYGDVRIDVPSNTPHFETTVPMSYNGVNFQVEIEAGVNLVTGEVYANFYSIEPLSGLPPEVDAGFLPPEDGTGRGQGYFTYTIKPKENLPEGTDIRNVAFISFDFQETIATNQVDPHDPSKGTDPNKEAFNTIAPEEVSLTIESTTGGTVISPEEGAYVQRWGEMVDLNAVSEAGFRFTGWEGDVDTVEDIKAPQTTVAMYSTDGDIVLIANFAHRIIDVPLTKGFNSISIPEDVTSQPDLRDWLPILGDANEIEKVLVYDHDTGKFVTMIPGDPSNESFLLHGGEGLMVYANVNREINFGAAYCSSHDFKEGFNFVGFACSPDDYSAFQLLHDLGSDSVATIQRFSPVKGAFETAFFDENGVAAGIDFPIITGEGYFVFITGDAPPTCYFDTQCETNSYCAKDIGDCSGAGICVGILDGYCTLDYVPVCGCDGRTYSNGCFASLAGVSIDYLGECF